MQRRFLAHVPGIDICAFVDQQFGYLSVSLGYRRMEWCFLGAFSPITGALLSTLVPWTGAWATACMPWDEEEDGGQVVLEIFLPDKRSHSF